MEKLECAARKKGFNYLILESGEPLVAAMALYRKIEYATTTGIKLIKAQEIKR